MVHAFRLALLLILCGHFMYAQTETDIDELENQLHTTDDPSERLKIYGKLIYEYGISEPTKARMMSDEALKLSENEPDNKIKADLFNSIGIAYHMKGNFIVSNEFFLESLKLYESINDSSRIANVLNNIGITYTEIRNFDKSREFYRRSYIIHKRLQNMNEMSASLNNLGDDFESEGLIDSAEYYYNKSLEIALDYDFKARMADAYHNLGSIQYKRRQLDEALDNLLKAFEIDLEEDNQIGLVETYGLLGEIYLELGNKDIAFEYITKALVLSKKLEMRNRESEIYQMLSHYYSAIGDYKNAYLTHIKYALMKDSIYTVESRRQIEDLQLNYENKKKEQEITLLSERTSLQDIQLKLQKTKTRLLLVFTLFAIFVLGLLSFNIMNKNRINSLLSSQNEKIQQQNLELERRSRKLIDISEEKDNFINVVVHDLKSPLNNIAGLSNLIRMNGRLSEEQMNYLNLLDQVSNEAKGLITNLLDINKLESANIEENYEEFNVEEVLDHEINLFRKDAQEKNITLIKKGGEDLFIHHNKEFFRRILNNLISNAIKFSLENKKVMISCFWENGYIQLKVKDEGLGIKQEEQNKLFKKFQRLSTRPTRGESSTGLGLAIVKLLVEKLKGEIDVLSEVNKGSEFIVKFPAPAIKLNI
jgi:signal transduction histidine kinase/Tfp pilus assembly protein PilF